MAATGWEFVGKNQKNTKKQKPTTVVDKAQKKSFIEKMPKIEANAPLKEDTTIYDAFLAKEKKSQVAPESTGDTLKRQPNGVNPTKKVGQQKKKVDKKSVNCFPLDVAIKEVSLQELESILEKNRITFPDNPSVWLKDLASYVNIKLDKVQELDPVFGDKPSDYPSNLLPSKVKKMLVSTMMSCKLETLELFFEHCIQSMINDLSKGMTTSGYRLFIQLMARIKPELSTSRLSVYLDLVKGNQNHPLRCLSIMWALGQCAPVSFDSGMQVWLNLMLPLINRRALSQYSVEYLEKLFTYSKNKAAKDSTVSVSDYFLILEVVHHGKLQSTLQRKLQGLYPKLKEIAFGSKPGSNLRNFFPTFLQKLGNQQLKDELLTCLVKCLSTDRHCYSIWRQIYTNNLKESSILLHHLVENWDIISRSLDKKLLMDTIQPFSITNEEMVTQGTYEAHGGSTQTINDCRILMERMRSKGFPWLLVIFSLLSAIGALVAYDVYINKTFQASKTRMLLDESGMLAFISQVLARVRVYATVTWEWCATNMPVFWAKVCAICGPYVQVCWDYLQRIGACFMAVAQPLVDWLMDKVPLLIEWGKSKIPWLQTRLHHYVGVIWDFILYYSLLAWQFIVVYLQQAGTWLQENIFKDSWSVDNIRKSLLLFLGHVQEYMSQFSVWILETWKNVRASYS